MPVTWVGWLASGLGAGFAFQAVNLHVMAFARPGEEGRATAASQFAGTFGNGIGTWLGGILLSTAMTKFPGGKVPALSYDGIVDDKRQGPTDNRMQICAKNNVGFSFTNLHLDKLDKNKPNLPDILTTDAAPYDCALPPLPAVSFPGL